jgi:hypothetical protein
VAERGSIGGLHIAIEVREMYEKKKRSIKSVSLKELYYDKSVDNFKCNMSNPAGKNWER